MLVLLPMIGKLTTRIQVRYLIAFGWISLAVGMYISARQVNLLISFGSAAWLRVLQSVPIPFLFVPLTMAGYVGLPAEKTNSGAGMMNFMRNIGQSVGTSAMTTVLARRNQFHQSVLAPFTSSARFHGAIQGLAIQLNHAGLGLHAAEDQALDRLYNMVQAQAAALSYVHAYWLLAAAGGMMFLASFLLKANDPGRAEVLRCTDCHTVLHCFISLVPLRGRRLAPELRERERLRDWLRATPHAGTAIPSFWSRTDRED